MSKILNILALLIRDIIVYRSKWIVEYIVEDGHFIYKWYLPFNLTLGKYRFLKKEDYNKLEL